MALITNGAACLQRDKLAASGLAHHFDAIVVSGDLGIGKPDASVFRHALALLGADHGVMSATASSATSTARSQPARGARDRRSRRATRRAG